MSIIVVSSAHTFSSVCKCRCCFNRLSLEDAILDQNGKVLKSQLLLTYNSYYSSHTNLFIAGNYILLCAPGFGISVQSGVWAKLYNIFSGVRLDLLSYYTLHFGQGIISNCLSLFICIALASISNRCEVNAH